MIANSRKLTLWFFITWDISVISYYAWKISKTLHKSQHTWHAHIPTMPAPYRASLSWWATLVFFWVPCYNDFFPHFRALHSSVLPRSIPYYSSFFSENWSSSFNPHRNVTSPYRSSFPCHSVSSHIIVLPHRIYQLAIIHIIFIVGLFFLNMYLFRQPLSSKKFKTLLFYKSIPGPSTAPSIEETFCHSSLNQQTH